MRKIRPGTQNKVNIAGILVSLAGYALNRFYIKKTVTTGIAGYFFKNHFNDLLCPLFYLSFVGIMLALIGYEIKSFAGIMILVSVCGFIWEVIGPAINPGSTGDWIDFFCYLAGGILYYLLLQIGTKNV